MRRSPRRRRPPGERYRTIEEIDQEVKVLEKRMRGTAQALEFEKAAELRDRMRSLELEDLKLG